MNTGSTWIFVTPTDLIVVRRLPHVQADNFREQTLDQIRLQKKSCNVQCHGQSELWEITSAAPLILLVCNTRPLIPIILAASQFSGGYWLDVFRTSTYVDEPPLTMTPRCLACWTAALMRLF